MNIILIIWQGFFSILCSCKDHDVTFGAIHDFEVISIEDEIFTGSVDHYRRVGDDILNS